jgi:cell wall-associated NlpC family hydrolase
MKGIKENIIKNCIRGIALVIMIGFFCSIAQTESKAATMHLSKTTLTLTKGATKKLKIKNLPAVKPKVKWSTSNKYAVTVSKKGKVTAVNYGTATIKATCDKKTFTCFVTVPDSSKTVTLNTESVSLTEGATYQLSATSENTVKYHSGNESIATVSETGKVTAVNPGIVTITAKSSGGYAKCVITVNSNDTEITVPSWVTNKKVTAIRRLTKKNNFVYDNITWAKGKDITFKIANLDESTVKKCVWSVADTTIVSAPVVSSTSKIQVAAKTLKQGNTKITAVVTDYNGKTTTYTSPVYISNPSVSENNITLLGTQAGSNRQKFVVVSGLSDYSKIEWSNSSSANATLSEYNTKAAVWGLVSGSGKITASVDGKKLTVNYVVKNPVFEEIVSVLAKGKTTKIDIAGIEGITPQYSIRNSKIAKIDKTGQITGRKAGVTYADVKIAGMTFSYRVEVAAKGMKTIIKRANYIVNNWKYNQKKRMKSGYYDCSSLVWKGYKAYKKYNKKLGSSKYALTAAGLFDYLYGKNQIVYFGYTSLDDLQAGDLIFYGDYDNAVKYSTPGRTLDIYHVSMYAGDGKVVEKGGQTINYNNKQYIVGIGRVVN